MRKNALKKKRKKKKKEKKSKLDLNALFNRSTEN